jgi:hypothetical protein
MSVTTTPRLGVHQWSAGTDPFTRAQLNASLLALENNAAMYSSGDDLNARPAAGKAGRFYLDKSVGVVWYDNGTTWLAVSAFGAMTHRAAAGQTDPLIKYANAAGTEVAQVATSGAGRFRGAAALLARSSVEAGVVNATDSRVVLGSAGTSGVPGDTPAIDLLRASSGSAGQAWRISAPSATGPLEIGGSNSGTAAWGNETILARLLVGRPSAVGDHALTVKGVASQTGSLLRCENSAGSEVASVSPTGAANVAGSLTVGGNLTVNGTISPSQTPAPNYALFNLVSTYTPTTSNEDILGAGNWTMAAYSSGYGFNAVSTAITVSVSGYYLVTIQAFVFNTGSAYPCMIRLKDASSNEILMARTYIPNAQNCTVTATKLAQLSASSSYKLYMTAPTSMTASLGPTNTYVNITKV